MPRKKPFPAPFLHVLAPLSALCAAQSVFAAPLPPWTVDAALALPEKLADTGLYVDAVARSLSPEAQPYNPQYPLWSDGLEKARWIALPEGTQIDNTDSSRWAFPRGTRLWKEFSKGGKPVETRLMVKSGSDAHKSSWRFAVYLWNEAGTEGTLLSADTPAARATWLELAPGKKHQVPAAAQCGTCHSRGGDAVLGFDALQLSTDRDPLAPHQLPRGTQDLDLAKLAGKSLLLRGDVDPAPQIAARFPEERAALGYLHGNCGSCHSAHADANAASSEIFLRQERDAAGVALDLAKLLQQKEQIGSELGENSPLVLRMAKRGAGQMPRFGTVFVDEAALRLLKAWQERIPPP